MISPNVKDFQAALAISNVYEKERLGDDAKTQYYIDVEELQKEDNAGKSR